MNKEKLTSRFPHCRWLPDSLFREPELPLAKLRMRVTSITSLASQRGHEFTTHRTRIRTVIWPGPGSDSAECGIYPIASFAVSFHFLPAVSLLWHHKSLSAEIPYVAHQLRMRPSNSLKARRIMAATLPRTDVPPIAAEHRRAGSTETTLARSVFDAAHGEGSLTLGSKKDGWSFLTAARLSPKTFRKPLSLKSSGRGSWPNMLAVSLAMRPGSGHAVADRHFAEGDINTISTRNGLGQPFTGG